MKNKISICDYLKRIAESVKLEINKTDIKCYDTEIFLINADHGQILFSLIKNNKKYKILENIYFDYDIDLVVTIIKENILINMSHYN